MQIEPIQLRPPLKPGRFLWVVNALLATCLLGAWIFDGFWHDTPPQALVAARTPARAASMDAPSPTKGAAPPAASTFDWDAALLALEKVQVDGVVLDSFKIDATSRVIDLTVSFETYGQLEKYHSKLNEQNKNAPCRLVRADRALTDGAASRWGTALLTCGPRMLPDGTIAM